MKRQAFIKMFNREKTRVIANIDKYLDIALKEELFDEENSQTVRAFIAPQT